MRRRGGVSFCEGLNVHPSTYLVIRLKYLLESSLYNINGDVDDNNVAATFMDGWRGE